MTRATGLPVALVVLALATVGCARTHGLRVDPICRDLQGSPGIVAEVFFGRTVRGRQPVTEDEWARFTQEVIQPRFPAGFTVLDGAGRWMDPDTRQIGTEKTKILLVSAEKNAETIRRLRQIAELYKLRFHQKSVGLVITDACSSFDA